MSLIIYNLTSGEVQESSHINMDYIKFIDCQNE